MFGNWHPVHPKEIPIKWLVSSHAWCFNPHYPYITMFPLVQSLCFLSKPHFLVASWVLLIEITRSHLRHLPPAATRFRRLLLSAQDVAHGAEARLQRQTDLGEGDLSIEMAKKLRFGMSPIFMKSISKIKWTELNRNEMKWNENEMKMKMTSLNHIYIYIHYRILWIPMINQSNIQ